MLVMFEMVVVEMFSGTICNGVRALAWPAAGVEGMRK